MTLIQIKQNDNGSHTNQTIDNVTPGSFPVPKDWAIVPENMLPLENFPFGEVTVEANRDGCYWLTAWKPLPIPDPGPEPEPTYTVEDAVRALIGG